MSSTQSSRQNVLISGASGFVGSALVSHLADQRYTVTRLVRAEPESAEQVRWDPKAGEIPDDAIASADVVINLSGASIAGGLWTSKRKRLILESRLEATGTLARAIARADRKPGVFINASGIGFYGDQPGVVLDENAPGGKGFLADVVRQWEAAADPAREAGIRVVHLRFGVVFSGGGGMLNVIKIPFKFGMGGKIGGDQYMSWIDLHDLVRIFAFVIEHHEIEGPVNAVAPGAVTNAQFTREMGKALHRPAIIPVPKRIASLAGGELVQELLLVDQHAVPAVLEDAGFTFERPTIGLCLEHAFRKS